MLNKLWMDLRRPAESYQLADDFESPYLGYYYFLFDETRISTGKDQALINKFDENGIPINKTYIDVIDKEYVYFPISIGQMGISIFHTFLKTQSVKDKERFLKFVDWFVEHAEVSEKFGARWLTDVSLPQYQNPGPWASAFAQARALNILLRGYQLTQNEKYAELAHKALKPFFISAQEGGVTSFTPWGPFYEEYTAKVPTMVLNGMVFSLCGLFDYQRVFPENNQADQLIRDGIETLAKVLPEYDIGFWSKYNNCQADWYPKIDPATILYQRLHVRQMEFMYRMTGIAVFQDYAKKFASQDTIFNALRMYRLKYKSLKNIGRL
ncbi:MAG: hypothetical protein JXQ65_15030 [Candidatus Marinimicrobia bacterium]|nr:hypothetical protein [Candidatus Neomarinimicrobiota bacterium]